MKYVTHRTPQEFKYNKTEQKLWCKLCRMKINSSRKSVVEKQATNLSILSSTVLPDNSNVLKAVDNCIASIKALTIKNKTRAALFYEIGSPPSLILTRWSSWLKAALYYCKYLPIVRNIVMKIDSDWVLVTNAKNAVESTDLIG
ncbi:hypothetical protein NGRA_1755 [Nosema granulosis]|uniref:Uncharacterized protein n=1 Tax=Nosema granulosis TaxID=83296 RepID=A0A9P6H0L8_9MICR|nr:hypothetical protein NGRA_1755 [Nosema granulosis]